VLVPNPEHHPQGDFTLRDGCVRNWRATPYYSGVGIYRPQFFDGCAPGKFPLLPLLRRAIAAGRLHGELHAGIWTDVGTIGRLERLNAAATA
jgi:MurNAc alpha-1-phosphate uridylyltransferase